ncbi:hypothetical protein ON010_g14468 [Phytophthora cinnamomi]|nr:hypothetical protein ON010_g14468 [Phytophthora cinnamomi]
MRHPLPPAFFADARPRWRQRVSTTAAIARTRQPTRCAATLHLDSENDAPCPIAFRAGTARCKERGHDLFQAGSPQKHPPRQPNAWTAATAPQRSPSSLSEGAVSDAPTGALLDRYPHATRERWSVCKTKARLQGGPGCLGPTQGAGRTKVRRFAINCALRTKGHETELEVRCNCGRPIDAGGEALNDTWGGGS